MSKEKKNETLSDNSRSVVIKTPEDGRYYRLSIVEDGLDEEDHKYGYNAALDVLQVSAKNFNEPVDDTGELHYISVENLDEVNVLDYVEFVVTIMLARHDYKIVTSVEDEKAKRPRVMAETAIIKTPQDERYYRLHITEEGLTEDDYEAGYNAAVDVQSVRADDFSEPGDGDGGLYLIDVKEPEDNNVLCYVDNIVTYMLEKPGYVLVSAG